MSDDLQNEVEAINSIYGDESLMATDNGDVYVLRLPKQSTSLRLHFPLEYPSEPPAVLGIESSGEHTRKGEGTRVVEIFRDSLGAMFRPGEVCLFDVIEDVNTRCEYTDEAGAEEGETEDDMAADLSESLGVIGKPTMLEVAIEPPWILSEVVIELKSVFIARCAPVSSPDQANAYLQHLLNSDKKVRSATHNITAWRITGEKGITFQDFDDDGETAAGGRVLHLMQLMDLWNIMVVVTRWYGGHQLGPKRFSIINTVARDAFVKAGLVKKEPTLKKGKH